MAPANYPACYAITRQFEGGNDDDPRSLTVVTSDRELARRARELGATVEGAGSLTRELGSERP